MRMKLVIAVLMIVFFSTTLLAAAEGHDPTLDGKYWQKQLVKAVNFLVILIAAYFILRKPIKQFFKKRADRIEEDLKSAERARQEAEARLKEVEQEVREINQKVDDIIAKAKDEAENERRRIIDQAENEARKIRETSENEINNRLKAARMELKNYATRLAVEQAREIIRDELTLDADRALIERNIKDIGGVH